MRDPPSPKNGGIALRNGEGAPQNVGRNPPQNGSRAGRDPPLKMGQGERGTPPQNGSDGGEGHPPKWGEPPPKWPLRSVGLPLKMAEGPRPKMAERDPRMWGGTPAPKRAPGSEGPLPKLSGAPPLMAALAGETAGHAGSCSLVLVKRPRGMLGRKGGVASQPQRLLGVVVLMVWPQGMLGVVVWALGWPERLLGVQTSS